MQAIPLLDVPSQTIRATLGGQSCRIELRQFSTALYCDLYVDDAIVIGGVACQDQNPIVRDAYLGFDGDLVFKDQQGDTDPLSPGLGTRFLLLYVEPTDPV